MKEILCFVNKQFDEVQFLFAEVKEDDLALAVLLGKVQAFRVVADKIHEIARRGYH